MILETFVGPRPEGQQCRHLDGDKSNNSLVNLCWGTSLENHADMKSHGTNARGDRHGRAKYTDKQIAEVRDLKGKRPRSEVAAEYGMRPHYVTRIWNGEVRPTVETET